MYQVGNEQKTPPVQNYVSFHQPNISIQNTYCNVFPQQFPSYQTPIKPNIQNFQKPTTFNQPSFNSGFINPNDLVSKQGNLSSTFDYDFYDKGMSTSKKNEPKKNDDPFKNLVNFK